MVNAIENDINCTTTQNQVDTVKQLYEQSISEIRRRNEENIQETVSKFTNKCEHLHSYIREAEKLLDEMDLKRKLERRQMEDSWKKQKSEIESKARKEIDRWRRMAEAGGGAEGERADQLTKLIDQKDDEIVCLKSKLHGLRTIVRELKGVEEKYKEIKKQLKKDESVQKSKDSNAAKKSRNNNVKTSRSKLKHDIYDETVSSKNKNYEMKENKRTSNNHEK